MQAFPSLEIRRDALVPRGPFAEAMGEFLRPDAETVARVDGALRENNVGVVAHFYMDPELQGVLTACAWPHIHISDSLVMADRAVKMATAGVRAIAVAGVDFMTENVRAVLDHAGFTDVPVYRLASAHIGCSLAASAEAPAYAAFLRQAQQTPHSLHVVYINTSLRTKALADGLVPTLTCTSSNVVQTILQATAQVPDLHIWFGPDTYMGANLRTLLSAYADLPDGAVHPAHTQASLRGVLERFHPFQQGHCIVHHLFGQDVVDRVRSAYPAAICAAHLEVPGEMFALASERTRAGLGVVGSTSNILDFIHAQVDAAVQSPEARVIQVVLGTEAGMITSIVRAVQTKLQATGRADVAVEIIFPVASSAVTQTGASDLALVPGAGAEGCSVEGGCATCPYMRMNHLDGLMDVVQRAGRPGAEASLRAFLPTMPPPLANGQNVAQAGTVPILRMRAFQATGQLDSALVSLLSA